MARGRPSKVKEDKSPLKSASVDEDYSKITGEISPEELIAAAKRAGVFVYDIETNNTLSPREGRIVCVGFYIPAKNEQKTEVFALFPFVDNTMVVTKGKEVVSLRPAMPQAKTMEELRPIWGLQEVLAISANGKFEEGWYLINPGTDSPIICSGPTGDSMLVDYTADERRRRYGLKGRVEEVFGVKMTQYSEASQHQSQLSFMNPKPLGTYNMEDCKWTYMLHEHALEEIRKQDPTGRLEKIYWGIEMKLRKIIVEMETTGCLIDFEHLIELESRLENQKASILAKIITSAGWAPNLRSPSQVSDFLFNSVEDGGLGLPTDGLEQNASGDYSTAEKVIKHFGRKNELVRALLEYRSLEVIDRSFCKKLIKIAQTEGRVFTGFSQTGTVTGRLSSSKPINLQNQPRDKGMIRKAFVAKLPGDMESDLILLDGDHSQIELRLIGHIAKEPTLMEVYNSGGKCNCDRFLYGYGCLDQKKSKCKWEGLIKPENGLILPTTSLKCPVCNGNVEYQERCRHVDIHQRTSEDVGVPRNPLAKNCVTGDSLVLTENGFMEMQELVTEPGRTPKRIGIVSDDGKIRYTDSTYNGGVQKVLDVNIEYGIKIRATPDHEFLTLKNGKVEKVQAQNLKPGDNSIIIIGQNYHGKNLDLPVIVEKKVTSYSDLRLPSNLDAETARFFGYVVSEGYIRENVTAHAYQVNFGFGKQDLDMVEDVERCFNHVVGEKVPKVISERIIRFTLSSKKLVHWLNILGMYKSSVNKSIPYHIRTAPWNIKKEFLRAYFEGDGTIKRNTVSVTSKSEKLIRQIHAEMVNIGILGNIGREYNSKHNKHNEPYGYYYTWHIQRRSEVRKFRELIGFIGKRKTAELDKICDRECSETSNKFLDGVECLLNPIYEKVKRTKKDKLREIIRRTDNPVRFGDTRVDLLKDDLPPEIRWFVDRNIWTAKVVSVEPAGEAVVYDVYEPDRTTMIIGCNSLVDCNFGISYRIGAPKFAIYADLFTPEGQPDISYAKGLIDKWMATYWRVPEWHWEEEQRLKQNNWIAYTLTGRRRRLDEEKKFNEYGAVTQAINFRVQATAQDIMKIGMIRVYEERERIIANSPPETAKMWKRLKFLLQVHDEVMFECPKPIVEEAKIMIKAKMEGAAKLLVPLVFSIKSGENWETCH